MLLIPCIPHPLYGLSDIRFLHCLGDLPLDYALILLPYHAFEVVNLLVQVIKLFQFLFNAFKETRIVKNFNRFSTRKGDNMRWPKKNVVNNEENYSHHEGKFNPLSQSM